MEEEYKKAVEKAMSLLLVQERTEKSLMERLIRAGFSQEAARYALEYVMSFGYVDDYRFASQYLSYAKGKKSGKELRYKLLNKGVPKEIIQEVFSEYTPEDEQDALFLHLKKKLKGRNPIDMERKEREKVIASLARKGFSPTQIRRGMAEWKGEL
jgi:regulatory protein